MRINTIIAFLAIVFFNLSTIGVTHAAIDKLKFDFCTYVGEVKRGKALGHGALSCEDGTNYVGQFKRNIINGDGILVILPPVIDNDWLKENPFPQISDKEKIIKLYEEVVKRMIDFKDVDNILTEEGQEKMREVQKNMKLAILRSPGISSWYANYLKEVVEVRGLMTEEEFLEKSQIFAGKWKNGKFIEYFDADKNFRRVTKLKKLNDIGGEGQGNQAALPPVQNLDQLPKPNNLDFFGNKNKIKTLTNKGTITNNIKTLTNKDTITNNPTVFNQDISGWDTSNVTDMSSMFSPTAESEFSFGEGKNKVSYVGETKTVNGKTLAHGIGTFTNENGDTVTGNFIDGKPHPNTETTMAFSDGGTITGFFDGKKGTGTYTDNLGSEIVGEFEFNRGAIGGLVPKGNQLGTLTEELINENGVTSFANRVGTFVNGYQVAGTVSYEDGRVFRGTCDKFGNPLDGTITDPNGDVSAFVDGMPAVDVPGLTAAANAAAAALGVAPPRNNLIETSTLQMKGTKNQYREARLSNGKNKKKIGKGNKNKRKKLERQKRIQKKLQKKLSRKGRLSKKEQAKLDKLNARLPSLADQAQGLNPVDVATAAGNNAANGSDDGAGKDTFGGIEMTAGGQVADQGGSGSDESKGSDGGASEGEGGGMSK